MIVTLIIPILSVRQLRHRLSNLPPRSTASKWHVNPRDIQFTLADAYWIMFLACKALGKEQSCSKQCTLPTPTTLDCQVLKHLLKYFCSKFFHISLSFSLLFWTERLKSLNSPVFHNCYRNPLLGGLLISLVPKVRQNVFGMGVGTQRRERIALGQKKEYASSHKWYLSWV